MNYRMFYTLHALCGFFVMLQLIFYQMYFPFHLIGLFLAFVIIHRFRNCRWAHFECCFGLIILYLFRVTLLLFLGTWVFYWYIYYLFLFIIGFGFLFISLRLFFC